MVNTSYLQGEGKWRGGTVIEVEVEAALAATAAGGMGGGGSGVRGKETKEERAEWAAKAGWTGCH
jgi:hypothetical protein